MPVPARLSIVTLGVTDLARSIAFYEAIGWRRSAASNDQIAFFPMAGSILALFGRRALAEDASVDGRGEGFPGFALAINCDDPAAVDAAAEAWVAAGGTLVKPPHRADWGGYSGYVADPDGHLWELAHNPYFPIDADGRVGLPG